MKTKSLSLRNFHLVKAAFAGFVIGALFFTFMYNGRRCSTAILSVAAQHGAAAAAAAATPSAMPAEAVKACAPCPRVPSTCGDAQGLAMAADVVYRYESPFLDVANVAKQKHHFKKLPAFTFPLPSQEMIVTWRRMLPFLKQYKHAAPNDMFNECDSAVLYSMVRTIKPRRVYEVGSGFSTKVAHSALLEVARETGNKARHLCIEPYRASVLKGLDVEVLEKPIQEVDLELFDDLKAGDLLFLDNSHVMRPYGDVILELLWILPRLKAGVYVHLHDIFLPYDYPETWVVAQLRPYTEQWMLAAFLYKNTDWEVVFNNGHFVDKNSNLTGAMNDEHADLYRKLCSFGEARLDVSSRPPSGSIYLRKVK